MYSLILNIILFVLLLPRFSSCLSNEVVEEVVAEERDELNGGCYTEEVQPISLDLSWTISDAFGGFFLVNVSVGTPPQLQQLVLDTESSDAFLHATGDQKFLQACSVQTPLPTCFSTCKYTVDTKVSVTSYIHFLNA
jgi:hypothetical protein